MYQCRPRGVISSSSHKARRGVALGSRAGPCTRRARAVISRTSQTAALRGIEASICAGSIANLNQVLADTKTATDMYKKHHWKVSRPTFYQLYLLCDKHFKEQRDLAHVLAERIQSLGEGGRHTRSPDNRRETPRTKIETVAIGDMKVCVCGTGSPLILLHDYTTTSGFWREQVDDLSRARAEAGRKNTCATYALERLAMRCVNDHDLAVT